MHAPPADLSVHRRVLGQTPEFGADFNGIVCTSADLDAPIVSADPIVASYIRQQAKSRTEATMSVAEEGEVFSDLVQAFRRELASRYVREGHQPLTEVSQRLGFSGLSSFSRWYRGVFGATAL